MKYLPSAKSPFWQILFAAQFFTLAYLLVIGELSINKGIYSVSMAVPLSILVLMAVFLVTAALALVAIRNYNKTHPKSKVSLIQVRPAELNDDDERLTGVTARATRNVYIYHNLALPILAVTLLFAQPTLPATIVLIGILTTGHYIAYWIGIKPALQD